MTDWHLELFEVHVPIECIEEIQEYHEEGRMLILELVTQHSTNKDEKTDNEAKGCEESREFVHHLLKHHD